MTAIGSAGSPSRWVDNPQSRLSKRMTNRPRAAELLTERRIPGGQLGGEAHHEEECGVVR